MHLLQNTFDHIYSIYSQTRGLLLPSAIIKTYIETNNSETNDVAQSILYINGIL